MAEYDKEKVKAILQDYEETLEVLTINSKPLINDLTMAAGRYKPLAPQIVAVIESRLFEVPVNQKLPLLYLLDSIMKNLRAKYLEIINTKVVAIFCHCFEKLTDPKIRISLYKLRQTWNPFVVKKKLAAIDKHVNALDPNWPVTATVPDPPSPTIHVNPDFLPVGGGKKVLPSAPSTSQSTPSASTAQSSSAKPTQTPSTKEVGPPPTKTLEEKRKNVLEAQKRKKEELMAKRGATITQDSAGSSTTSLSSSLADPRKASAVSATVSKAEVTGSKRGKKRASRASRKPRKPLSSRSSLSPDYESKSSEKKKKLSRRPRSASPAPSHTPSASQQDIQPRRGGLGEILKGLDISSLMGSIQRVKEQTEGETRSPAAPAAEDTNTQPKVDQPPPEKKPKLEDDVVDLASSTAQSKQEEVGGAKPVVLSKQEEVGGVKSAAPYKQEEVGGVKVAEEEEEEGLPAIKKSHLNLDDIPMELLPTHQERIMKQVESQLKSGRLSEEQHLTLVKQLDQLYALQRKKENGRDGRERVDTSPPSPGPPRQRTPSPQPASGTISLPSSDNLRSCHNHLPTPHTITTHPPPPPPPAQQVVSDSEFHTHSPPSLPGPHLDRRHPHTHSPPRDRYRPRNHPKMGPRAPPRPQRGNRGRRPFNRQPRPPVTRPAIDWDGRGEEPMDHHQGGQEDHSGVAASTEYPPNQGNAGGGSNPTELFTRLVQFGLINEGEGPREGGVAPRQPTGPPPVQQQQQQQQQVPERAPPLQFAIPKLSFTVATLKKPYSGLVQLMHMGEPCATCGLRFRDRSTADYSSHLDWHYKINSRDKAQQRPRNWFLHPEDWMKFEESTSGEDNREPLVLEREVEGMEEGGEGEGVASEEGERTSCEVLPGEEAEVCTICEEQFEQFWEEELEEWHFKEAIREGGKLYHTYCYQDAKESGALDRALLLQQPTPTETEQKPLAVA